MIYSLDGGTDFVRWLSCFRNTAVPVIFFVASLVVSFSSFVSLLLLDGGFFVNKGGDETEVGLFVSSPLSLLLDSLLLLSVVVFFSL